MSVLRRQRDTTTATYGTIDFTAVLAAREAALGIGIAVADELLPPVTSEAPSVADTTHEAEAAADDAPYGRDAWGNALAAPRGWHGQYRIVGRDLWTGKRREVYVCGQPQQHVRQGYWRLDGRMEQGQGYICCCCWALEADRYGERG